MVSRRLGLLALLLATGTTFAEPMRAASPPPAVTSAGSLLQVVLALGVVVAAVYGVAWLLKRMSPLQTQGAGALRVVGATSVGQRERVVLVEINDTWLVVGVAPGQVSALHTLPKPAHAAQAAPVQNGPQLAGEKFAGWLKQTLERKNGPAKGDPRA